jgi:hypothetical protein
MACIVKNTKAADNPVIASQRARPEVAGPMTGSAKQSKGNALNVSGLLRRPSGSSQ